MFDLFNLNQDNVPLGGNATTTRDSAQPNSAIPEPSLEDIEMLTSMGFPREAAVEALKRHENNVQAAINSML